MKTFSRFCTSLVLISSLAAHADTPSVDEIVAQVSAYAEDKYKDPAQRQIARRFIDQKRRLMLARTEAELRSLAQELALDSICIVLKGDSHKKMDHAVKTDVDGEFDRRIPPSLQQELDAKWKPFTMSGMDELKRIAETAQRDNISPQLAFRQACAQR